MFCHSLSEFVIIFVVTSCVSTVVSGKLTIRPSGPIFVAAGRAVFIDCATDKQWRPDLRWFRVPLAYPSYKKDTVADNVTFGPYAEGQLGYQWVEWTVLRLIISSAVKQDSGTYWCVNELDRQERSSVTLHVVDSPQIQQNSSDAMNHSCHHFKCQSTGHCIFKRYRCDGFINCFDASDELGCDVNCAGRYRCGSGECVDGKLLCDNKWNCRDGSDELRCHLSVSQHREAEFSTVSSSLKPERVHSPTHFHALYSVFASVIGLLCISIIIFTSVWRFRRQRRTAMVEMSRQRGGRRLVSTYPQMQAGGGGSTTDAAVILPPPYCDVVDDGPPPYSTVAGNKPAPDDPQSHEVESLRQSDPSDSLLNEPV